MQPRKEAQSIKHYVQVLPKVFNRIENKTRHERTNKRRCSKAPATLLQAFEAVRCPEAAQLHPVRGIESVSPGMDTPKFSPVDVSFTMSGIPVVGRDPMATAKEPVGKKTIVPDVGISPSAFHLFADIDPDRLNSHPRKLSEKEEQKNSLLIFQGLKKPIWSR